MSDSSYSSLNTLYQNLTDSEAIEIIPLTEQGSQRKYYRLSGSQSCIGVIGNVAEENNAFIYLSETLRKHGVKLPQVLISPQNTLEYLQEDLGDVSLYDIIQREGFSPLTIKYCRQSLDELVNFQLFGLLSVDTSRCYPIARMDSRSIQWDLNYFKYCFLKALNIEIDEPRLEDEFERLTSSIISAQPYVLIHRDFQSRNIMVNDGVYFIDFQGARLGPALYDAVSFLWQSRIAMPQELRDDLLSYYLSRLCSLTGLSIESVTSSLWSIVTFRMLQVLGAYGYRGLYQNKVNFISSIPYSIKTLLAAIEHSGTDYLYLKSVAKQALALTEKSENNAPSNLTVHVISFSYKKGYPLDDSGNGGGFVFDCRAIHNPGRYPEYVNLTGNDQEVKTFLETKSEINSFINECKKLVDRSVEVYIRRGFSHLSVAFGCTGGQHRSVYSANAMASYLSKKYNVKVVLTHREQSIEIIYNPSFIKSAQ